MAFEAKEKKKPGRPGGGPPGTSFDPIYTDEQAAANVLNCNLRVLREKFKSGEIGGYKKLGKWYTLHSDLVAYLKSE